MHSECSSKQYTAEIRNENNKPSLYVNGKKCPPMIYCLSDIPASSPLTAQAQKNIGNFAAQGIDIVCTDVNLYKGWRKNGKFDPDFILGDLEAITEVNPHAAIILRLHVNPPYWWMRDNPDELCEFGVGNVPYVDNGEYERLITDDGSNAMRVSLSSEKWKKDTGKIICKLIESVADTPQGHHIIGIQTACGINGEWHQWGICGFHPDYGKSMTKYFRSYLRKKYSSVSELRNAWKNDASDFDNAVPAPYTMRFDNNAFPLRNPTTDKYVLDSLEALMRSTTDAIIYFSDVIKSNWGRKILIGTFYGYYDSWDEVSVYGHLDVEYLIKSGKVDYLSGPFHYGEELRCISGATAARSCLESHRINGILWLTEMDQAPIGSHLAVGGIPKQRKESIAILRRNVLEPITRGMGMWYYDHRLVLEIGNNCSIYRKKGWWDHPELLKEIRMLQAVGRYATNIIYRSSADVLLVFDTESRYYSNAHDAFSLTNAQDVFLSLGKCGAVYDSIYLHDIDKVDLDGYRCVIFIQAIYLPEEKRNLIKEKLYNNDRHIVWINENGFLNESDGSTDLITDMTGMRVQSSNSDGRIIMNIASIHKEINPRISYSLSFSVCDDATESIAKFSDTKETAAAKKAFSEYTLWYFSTFPTDQDVLRELFRSMGVHIYTDNGEGLLVGNGLAVITVDRESDICLRLKNGKIVEEKLPAMTTAIYNSESGKRLDTSL